MGEQLQIVIRAYGRPAPQGSHEVRRGKVAASGEAFLAAWRSKVKKAAYEAYAAAGIPTDALPLIPAGVPVVFDMITFYVLDSQCRVDGTSLPVGTPDVDKLLRSTLDALSSSKPTSRFRGARLYADDSQVVGIGKLSKQRAHAAQPAGALIVVRDLESNAAV